MAHSILLRRPAAEDAVIENIVRLFLRKLAERCGVAVCSEGTAELTVTLTLRPGGGAEGFTIEDAGPRAITIAGADARGLLYGVGKFLRTARFAPGELLPGDWRGSSVPQKPVRGIYFASHFHNFYHDAPVDEIERYVEDLALWGTNVVSVWFDMHHFYGIEDPQAQAMLERLRVILHAAKRIGIGACLTTLANEGYANSPEALRADWTAGHDGYHHEPGGHYHVELCPHKPGAIELELQWAAERLAAFAEIGLDYVWIWPYDQGGCTCAACAPWGVNGFLKIAEPLGRFYRAQSPQTKVVLSTWYFDHFTDGEWEGLAHAFAHKPDWVDYLIADDYGDHFPAYPLAHGAPGGFPMVNFPEISMYACGPWGGFGANPFPRHLQAIWDASGQQLAGGFPYSEGIYEDINKAICAQFYWQQEKPASDTVREYLAYEFSPEVSDDVYAAVELLERSLPRTRDDRDGVVRFVIQDTTGVEEAYALLARADAALPEPVRACWRWRILYLRGLIDHELLHHDFTVSDRCEAALQELEAIYHAEHALYTVAPPTRQALATKEWNMVG